MTVKPDPMAYPPRGLTREEAARYVGVPPGKFDEMVADRRMPRPRKVDRRSVWDRYQLDASFSELPDGGSWIDKALAEGKNSLAWASDTLDEYTLGEYIGVINNGDTDMTKTTYIATDANGTVHTRKTERSYSHTVVFQRSKDTAIAHANQKVAWDIKHGQEQIANAGRTIEQNKAFLIAKRCGILAEDDVYATKMQTEGQAFVAQWGTAEAYAAARHVENIAEIEKADAAGYFAQWANAGWCGRLDLAHKLAAQYTGSVILPAQAA